MFPTKGILDSSPVQEFTNSTDTFILLLQSVTFCKQTTIDRQKILSTYMYKYTCTIPIYSVEPFHEVDTITSGAKTNAQQTHLQYEMRHKITCFICHSDTGWCAITSRITSSNTKCKHVCLTYSQYFFSSDSEVSISGYCDCVNCNSVV